MPQLVSAAFFTLSDTRRMRYVVIEPDGPLRATIVVAPGRREFLEKKMAELGRELSERGLRAVFLEWRGQGISDRSFEGTFRQRDHITDLSTYVDDLRAFARDCIPQYLKDPTIVLGHSLGGHLILRWLAEDQPPEVLAAIVTSPMLALGSPRKHRLARFMSWFMVISGRGASYGPNQHDYGDNERIFEGNPLTQDENRFRLIDEYFEAEPDLKVGGVTWQWLQSALRSMRLHLKSDYFSRIKVPVLILVGSADRVTPAREIERSIKYIPNCTTVNVQGARHDILNESDTYRLEAWKHIDAFLDALIPER